MKQLIFISLFLYACTATRQVRPSFASTQTFQLAPPKLSIDSIFFQTSATIELALNHPNTHIHYTLDGTEVTENAPLYSQAFLLKTSSTIKAKAFHPDFIASETIEQAVLKRKPLLKNATIHLQPMPNEKYAGEGLASLTDLKKGSSNFRANKAWLGFQTKVLHLNITFEEATAVKRVILSALEDNGAWIFLPKQIIVRHKGQIVGEKIYHIFSSHQSSTLHFLDIPLIRDQYQTIQIEIVALSAIPDWHVGKGTIPWLFLDELLID